jgi:uncharacterized repeat protein (TIGR03803 family)
MKNLVLIISFLFIALTQNAQTELWGMTAKGGVSNNGVLFQFDISNSICTKKLDFSGVTNGSLPNGSLFKASDGRLYGMTATGGQNGFGTIFQYDLSTGTYTKKFDFDGVAHGSSPNGSLMQATDGFLYGLTILGGINNKGVIFKFDINTSICTKVFDFNGANGLNPNGNLIQFSDGLLYGLTVGGGGGIGGSNNNGELFQFNPVTNILVKKVILTGGLSGYNPFGSLVQAIDGKLYGMILLGGTGNGLIFQYDPSLNTYTVKVNLGIPSNPGAQPWGSLISASDGKLYGMTEIGGMYNSGVLFQYDPVSNIYLKIIDFDGINTGGNPKGSLIQSSNGKIYGLTTKGGANNFGVLFEYDPITLNLSKKLDFDSINGSMPAYTSLIEVPSIPTRIHDFDKVSNLSLYPNPNNGSFTIELKTKSQITITNVLGESVLNQLLEIGKQNLSIQSQADGIYFVKVTDDKGLSTTKKIVVQK